MMRHWILLACGLALAVGVTIASAASLSVTTQGLVGYKTCTIEGSTSATTSEFDNYVRQDAPSGNNGTLTTISVTSNLAKIRRGFFRFDLAKCSPAIASSATVQDARLRLFLSTAPNATRSYSAFMVTTPCPEGLSTCWGQTTQTWNNQPSTAGAASDTISLGSGSATSTYYSWTVTADTKTFVAGTASNYGWSIRDANEDGTNTTATFRSLNQNNATSGPQLIITYTP